MSSFSRSKFLLLISLTLLILLGGSSLRSGSLRLAENTGSLPSSRFGAAAFLHPIPITPLLSFPTTFSFLAIKNPDQDLNFPNNNAISFFLRLPNTSTPAMLHSPRAVKDNSLFLLQFPIAERQKDANFSLITATISLRCKKGGILLTASAGNPPIIIKEETLNFIPNSNHIYAGFLSSNTNNSESHVIQSRSLSPQSARRIALQSKKSSSIRLDILIRATILASSAAVVIIAGFNIKQHLTPNPLKRKRAKQSLLKNFQKFKFSEIVSGTNNFSQLIGRGGSARVYKMNFPPSSSFFFAVKRFTNDDESIQSYHNELETISRVQHDNILQLKGWCDKLNSGENILIFDYMPNGSLHNVLHSQKNPIFPFTHRRAIAIKLAAALKHLHHECSPPIVHGDIKCRNIMVTNEYEPKLADFGMSRVGARYKAVGVGASELQKSVIDEKADVGSYGVVVIEICTGRMATDMAEGFVEVVREMEAEGRLLEAADERLGDCFEPEEMLKLLRLGVVCACGDRERRPAMAWVVKVLNGEVEIDEVRRERVMVERKGKEKMIQ